MARFQVLDIKQNGVLDYEELKAGGYVVEGKLHQKYTSFEERRLDPADSMKINAATNPKSMRKAGSGNDLASLSTDEKFASTLGMAIRSQQMLKKSVDDLDMSLADSKAGTPKTPPAQVLRVEFFLGRDDASPPIIRNGSARSNASNGRPRVLSSPDHGTRVRVGSVGMEYDTVSEIDFDSDEDVYDEGSVRDIFTDDEDIDGEDGGMMGGECELTYSRTPEKGEQEYINVMHT
jgi:hypothetical protein